MQSKITRRQFISKVIQGCVGASFLSGSILSCAKIRNMRGKFNNIFMTDGKPLLVIVRGKNLRKMVDTGLNLLLESGGRQLSKSKLYIKPNATTNEPYPVTTDVHLLSALVGYFQEYGSSEISIGDNPSYRGIYIRRIFKDQKYFDLKKEYRVGVLPNDPGIGYSYR
jgi:hypothetical protein